MKTTNRQMITPMGIPQSADAQLHIMLFSIRKKKYPANKEGIAAVTANKEKTRRNRFRTWKMQMTKIKPAAAANNMPHIHTARSSHPLMPQMPPKEKKAHIQKKIQKTAEKNRFDISRIKLIASFGTGDTQFFFSLVGPPP